MPPQAAEYSWRLRFWKLFFKMHRHAIYRTASFQKGSFLAFIPV